MEKNSLKYIIITPANNEEEFIKCTLDSVCNQTLKPEEWIIVDDGSTDNTSKIVEKYTKSYNWIRLVSKSNVEEKRSGGIKVVRAFETGFNELSCNDYNFIVKLDADLTIPNYYFETVASEFKNNKTLGICGGVCVLEDDGKLIEEKAAEYHIRGAIKAYKKECFKAIGGLAHAYAWDVIDEYLAMYNGWEVKKIEFLKVIHLRESGKETGQFRLSLKMGKFCYKIGYDPFLTFLRSIRRTFDTKINLLNGLGIFIGYLEAIFSEKLLLKEHRKFVREFQYRRIKRKLKERFGF